MRIRMAGIAAVLFLCVGNVTTAQTGQELFQQGRLKEIGERDLDAAIKIYERVAREFKSNHFLAANALARLGEIHDVLGKSRAREYYDQIIRDYPDQTEIRIQAERRRKAMDSHTVSASMPDRMIWQNSTSNAVDASSSVDGSLLAYIDKSPGGGLMLRDLRKGETRRLVPAVSEEVRSPAISRDGRRVAYSRYDAVPGASELHVVDVDTRADRILHVSSNLRYLPQDWTAAGKILTLFSLKGGGYQIAMVDASGGSPEVLKTFLNTADPPQMTLSPDGRFIAYDYPQEKGATARDIFILGNPGGNYESDLVRHTAHDYVLGWMPDSKWLLFGSDRGGNAGIWAVETSEGRPGAIPPVQIPRSVGEIRSLGTTRSGSLLYSPAGRPAEVRVLEGLQPELARLQLAAFQPAQLLPVASIEGVVVKFGTDEPIPGADLELIRLEGTPNFPLSPGFAEAFAGNLGAGAVLNGPTGPTISGAMPSVLAPEVQSSRSGEDGKYVFRNLKPGKYRLTAALADGAYHPAQYGQRDPDGNGLLLPVAEGQAVRNIRIQMPMTGVITGRVFDSDGAPAAHVPVFVSQGTGNESGEGNIVFRQAVLTDELGNYRFFWLPPKRYLVSARLEDADRASLPTFVSLPGRTVMAAISGAPSITRRMLADGSVAEETYRRVYHGDTLDFERAKRIDLRSGGQVSGVDIHAGVGRTTARHIRGILINAATGQPAGGVLVRAVRLDGGVLINATTDRDGAFDFAGITAGAYALNTNYLRNAAAPGAAGTVKDTIAYMRVDVGNADIDDLRLVASYPVNSPGRITIEGRTSRDIAGDLSKIRVVMNRNPIRIGLPPLVPPGQAAGNGVVNESGAFTLWTSPGRYGVFVTGIPTNTYVKSIRLGDIDVLKGALTIISGVVDPFEIVIGTDAGGISGTAMSGATPLGNSLVVLVPELPQARLSFPFGYTATSDADGKFQFPTVPPGAYKVFAWEYLDEGLAWMNPDFLRAYEASGKVVLVSEGTRQEIQVAVLPQPK